MYSSIQVAPHDSLNCKKKKGSKELVTEGYAINLNNSCTVTQKICHSYEKKSKKKTFTKEILKKDIFKLIKYTEKQDVCGISINLV